MAARLLKGPPRRRDSHHGWIRTRCGARLVPRRRLTELVERGTQGPLTLISAPAGGVKRRSSPSGDDRAGQLVRSPGFPSSGCTETGANSGPTLLRRSRRASGIRRPRGAAARQPRHRPRRSARDSARGGGAARHGGRRLPRGEFVSRDGRPSTGCSSTDRRVSGSYSPRGVTQRYGFSGFAPTAASSRSALRSSRLPSRRRSSSWSASISPRATWSRSWSAQRGGRRGCAWPSCRSPTTMTHTVS